MMKRLLSLALMAFALNTQAQEPADLVNPFVGTTNFGATHPGAVCPSGMMSVVPFNVMGSDINKFDKDSRWWSAPYERDNSFFTGYAHVSLSGVGCPEASSLLTMPTTGTLNVRYSEYGSEYSDEIATPGYFSNYLTKYGIKTEVTATTRTSVERYTFPEGEGNILLNLGEGLTNESGAMVRRVSSREVEGVKLLGTFCYNPQVVFPIYFVMQVDREPSQYGYWKMQRPMKGVEAEWTPDNGKYKLYTEYDRELSGDDIGCWWHFDDLAEGEQVVVRVGVSFVSIENARENLRAEQQGKCFDEIRTAAREAWNSDLGCIKVKGGTKEQQSVFYTALYHALIHPSVISDVNGEYPMMESGKTGRAEHTRYSVFSLWDTYRNLHPLLTLVYPERQNDMVRSLIGMYNEWGWLPRWELFGRETYTMEGDPAAIVIADTWVKGIRDYDVTTAYEAMIKSATTTENNPIRSDIKPYIEKGYIPLGYFAADLSGDNSVSHVLEYCSADYAISQLADSLGKRDDAKHFKKRSYNYRNYYCKQYGSLRPLTKEGKFLEDFDASVGMNFENVPGFHEGSAWGYTFAAAHDVDGLVRLMGGKKRYINSLQNVFDKNLYDPANEPDILYPYLFSRFKGEEWRTQQQVSRLLKKHFTTAANGIPGNDDTGTMSAWAVFSMIGIYPDCPGEPYYTLTTPVFDEVMITTPLGNVEIKAPHASEEDIYIDAAFLGDKKLSKMRVKHQELLREGKITYQLKNSAK